MYSARVLSDCVMPASVGGQRVTTVEATYPRMILSEQNTHRSQSRNSASSRAKKPEDVIAAVLADPYVPLNFNKRVKGMGVGEPLSDKDAKIAFDAWIWGRDQAVRAAQILVDQEVDKSRVNRILEPYMWHTMIMTGVTQGWNNYFALRYHKGAQPEFNLSARVMLKEMLESEPRELMPGEWSLPLVDPSEFNDAQMDYGPTDFIGEMCDGDTAAATQFYWPMVSASRCARVSYDTHENFEPVSKSMERAKMLVTNGHLSPMEHVVKCPVGSEMLDLPRLGGNLPGVVQLRKLIPHEDNRVGFLEGRESWQEMEIPEIPELVAA